MGEAKRKGTFEQRKQAATPRKKKMSARERDFLARKATVDFLFKIFESNGIKGDA